MAGSRESVPQKIIRGCSSALLVTGGVVLLFGDRFFRRTEHVGFPASIEFSLGAGFLIMLLGAALALALKAPESSSRVADRKPDVEAQAMESITRVRVNTRREIAAKGLGGLYDRLQELFYKYDPLELGQTPSSKDEYGSPVSTVIPRLIDCSRAEELQFVIEQEMDRHYPECECDSRKIATLAEECWKGSVLDFV